MSGSARAAPQGPWPDLVVTLNGGRTVNAGGNLVTGFTVAVTSASDLPEGDNLTISVTGNNESVEPVVIPGDIEFIRIDRFILEIAEFLDLAPLGVEDWTLH